MKNFYVKFEVDNTFKQSKPFIAYDTETATAAYTLINGGIGTDITNKKGLTILNIHFIATNIADVAYQNHLSRLKYGAVNAVTGRTGVFNMGRNFSIKINIPISFDLKK